MQPAWPPVLGICGFSGSGKTPLIEQIIPKLLDDGLSVAVLKHDAHRLSVDREGKDTARFFAAGANVIAHDAGQVFVRTHGGVELADAVRSLGPGHDLVLVEGHKGSDVPKLWVGSAEESDPGAVTNVLERLPSGPSRTAAALGAIRAFLRGRHADMPTAAGILIGGRSRRMGSPKALLPWGHGTVLEHLVEVVGHRFEHVVLLGGGPIGPKLLDHARLADIPGVGGPVAGIAAALRWAPNRRWLILPTDSPRMDVDAIDLLLTGCGPGRWAVTVQLPDRDRPEPLGAIYDPPMGPLFERALRQSNPSVRDVLREAGPRVAVLPAEGAAADPWQDCNDPQSYQTALRTRPTTEPREGAPE